MDLPDFGERYEVEFPVMSLHNFIIGTPYIDIGETMTIHKANSPQKAIINFHRRGWFGKDKDIAKLEGEIVVPQEGKKKSKNEPLMLITGNWNADIFLQKVKPAKEEPEMVWRKAPYP